ncbi:MAG: hypothetical protein R2704_16165 [Microthrixaceae bacterium]
MAVEAAPGLGTSTPGDHAVAGSEDSSERELPEAPTTAYVPAPDASADAPASSDAAVAPPKEPSGELIDDDVAAALDRPLFPMADDAAAPVAAPRATADPPAEELEPESKSKSKSKSEPEPEPAPAPARAGRRGSTRRFTALTVTFAVLLVALAYTGYRSSLRMTGGATISPQQRSPSDPGYEAAVKPTPVTFLALVDDGGGLRSMSVVTQGTGETGGTVVTIPNSLFLKNEAGDQRIPPYILAEDGMEELQTELESAVGFGMTDQLTVTQSEIGSLLGGDELEIRNPEQLLIEYAGVLAPQFEAGDISLDPEGLMAYLNYLGAEESEYNRLNRQQLVLERLLELSAEGFEPTDPNDNVTALDELLTAVGSGDSTVTQLPVEEARIGGREFGEEGQGASFTAPDVEAIDATLGDIVPFPISGFPGQRLGVKLLNGTSEAQLELRLASDVVGAGAEVKVVGNAKVIPQPTSSVAVSEDATAEEREQAQRVADVLDAEMSETDALGEDVRAVVVVGQDQL